MSNIAVLAHRTADGLDEFRKRWERLDQQLSASREYLALLEADPTTDELPIVFARSQLLKYQQDLAKAIGGED
jgi:hypothetical protein